MTKYGETSWDEPVRTGSKGSKSYDKEKFITLEEGINVIRIVTNPFKYYVHKVTFEGDDNAYGRNIRCAVDNCPLCAQGLATKEKWVVGAINRKNGEAKFLEIGPQIYQSINTIRQLPDLNNVKDYDLSIIKNKKSTPVYTVIPAAKTPLSVNDIEKADKINLDELNLYVQPIPPEEVTNSMNRIAKWIEKNAESKAQNSGQQRKASQKQVAKQAQPAEEPSTEATEISDDSFNFKPMKK